MSYFQDAGVFLIQTLFGFFILLFLARVLLIAIGASFYDPICRFVYTLTNPVITPIRRFVPRWRKIELASLLIAWLLALIQLLLFAAIGAHMPNPAFLLIMPLVMLLDWLLWIEQAAIFVICILSFVATGQNANTQLLFRLTEPVVRPFRRLIPPIAGWDLSYLFASIVLVLVRLLVVVPLSDLAVSLR